MNDTYHLNVLNIIIWKYHCGFNSSFDGFFFNIKQLKEDNMVIVKYYKQVHKGRWHPSFRDWEPNSARLPDYIGKKHIIWLTFSELFFLVKYH